ncbi:hypothetical protein ruthe_03211 [Rubellimicrobium thermophilum DSM 16684]|uniref:Uncharacterized protein n=1 Tax=Rubellimicrobium thermophilum DSM 16684 TaxID=1123069 RepID=S9S905_9RHOB|nr:hypothetical protein ruthe_03211 [Rubellimicrobium thermophilum DSM 16684]
MPPSSRPVASRPPPPLTAERIRAAAQDYLA